MRHYELLRFRHDCAHPVDPVPRHVRGLGTLRSVTQAADELCVTPSAVSHRVRQLEQIIGTKLFGRSDFSLSIEGSEAHGIDAGELAEDSSFNDIGLMCDAAAQGLASRSYRLKLEHPWLENGTLERISPRNVPSPHAHDLCWRTGAMDRWECAAFAKWLQTSVA